MSTPPTFHGYDAEDINDFFGLLESYFGIKKVNQEVDKNLLLEGQLRGATRIWFEDQPWSNWNNTANVPGTAAPDDAVAASYANRKLCLTQRYNTDQRKLQNSMRLQTMTMGPKESPNDYYTRLCVAAKRAGIDNDGILQSLFLHGLSHDLLARIQERGESNGSRQREIAQNAWMAQAHLPEPIYDNPYVPRDSLLQSVSTSILPARSSGQTDTRVTPNQAIATDGTKEANKMEKKVDDLVKSFAELKVHLAQNQPAPNRMAYNPQNRPENRQRLTSYNRPPNLNCYNCGKSGHISRYCRAPPINQQRRQPPPQMEARYADFYDEEEHLNL
jgi:hypothetical protein